MRSGSSRIVLLALSSVAVLSCSADPTPPSPRGSLRAELLVTRSGLKAVRVVASDRPSSAALIGEHVLRWVLRRDDGSELTGVVDDPRWARAELGEGVEAVEERTDVGAVAIDLPAPGELVLFEPARAGAPARVVGKAPIALPDPARAGSQSQPLLDATKDVLGSPTPVLESRSAHPVKILFFPEGYREEELPAFHAELDGIARGLASIAGYREHWHEFSLYFQDVRSKESGISDPRSGAAPDTAFDIQFGDDSSRARRCVWFNGDTREQVLPAALAIASDLGADAVVFLANTSEYGGCANNQIVITRNPSSAKVLAHELGHKLFALNDEYTSSKDRDSCHVHRWRGPNVADDLASLPWADLVSAATLPTPSGGDPTIVGAFEGAGGCPSGVYRPQADCGMRSLGADYCTVCRREIDRFFERRAAESP